MIASIILAALAVLSLLLNLWQWLAARRFPLHERVTDKNFTPPISLLKPLKNCDAETGRCLESWLKQNYSGEVQILFGVASADDPVCSLVRKLMAENLQVEAELILCAESFGANAKVSTLVQLQRKARHEIIVISDADIAVPNDFLANVVAPLRDVNVGLVNCFYRLANPQTLAMQWEAIAINADFWSQVLQAKSLKPIDFALGAVMATRRENLKTIGGFESLVNFLADDYQLGNRIARAGKKIILSPVVVECWERPMNFREVFAHQLRWARTIRICQPLPYFFSILSNATLWPLVWLVYELFAVFLAIQKYEHDTTFVIWHPHPIFFAPLVLIAIRILIAMELQRRLTKKYSWIFAWLVPIKDLLGAIVWALAFFGNKVEWRGERYKILRSGKLEKLSPIR